MTLTQPVALEELGASDVPILRTEIPGPRSRSVQAREGAHAAPGLSALATLSGVAMQEGRGALVRDVDGNVFIDFSSGTVVNVTGYSHPRVVARIQEELENFIHVYDYSSETRAEFFDALASVMPPGIDRFQMYSSGAETVEA